MLTEEEQQQAIDEGWERSKEYWLSKGLTENEAELANLVVIASYGSLNTKYREFRQRIWKLAAEDE